MNFARNGALCGARRALSARGTADGVERSGSGSGRGQNTHLLHNLHGADSPRSPVSHDFISYLKHSQY